MIKDIKEKKMVEQDVSVGLKITCDCCKRIIFERTGEKDYRHSAEYYHITAGHRDWGNDSCESIEMHDACSEECLSNIMDKLIEDFKG